MATQKHFSDAVRIRESDDGQHVYVSIRETDDKVTIHRILKAEFDMALVQYQSK